MRLEDFALLNDEIAALVRAGVPLEPSLAAMGSEGSDRASRMGAGLARRMEAGHSLGEALAAERQSLPAAYCAIVEAGLAAGRLPAALEAVSSLALELVELRRRLGVALTYPFVVGIVAYGLFLTIITATLEQFRATFVDFGYRIPPALELLFQASRLLERAWWAPLLALAACLLWWVSTGASHLFDLSGLARPLALVPGMAAIGRHYRCAHFAELLALLVEHAVPLPRALRLASGAAGDSQLRAGVEELAQRVEQADAAPARRRRGRLPRYLAWIISHGARQRDWPRLLRHAASIHRRRALAGANWLKLLLPVACSVLMGGGIVICYAAATFGPIAALWLSLGAD